MGEDFDFKSMFQQILEANNDARVAASKAERLIAEYNVQYNNLRAKLNVIPGFEIDVLGDGQIKPADKCSRVPS